MRTKVRSKPGLIETPDGYVRQALNIVRQHPGLAIATLERALKIDEDHLAANQLVGVILHQNGRSQEAKPYFEKLCKLDPENAENWANLGTALGALNRKTEAIEAMEKALALKPDEPLFKNNLAIQYQSVGKFAESIELFEECLKDKETAQLWENLGNVYTVMGDYEKAKECLQKAIALDPKYVPAQVHLGLVHHFLGDWKAGFKQYEWRFLYYPELQPYLSWYNLSKMWDGKKSLEGKRVVVFGEQGFGDVIMFSRFIKLVKARGAHVILHCDEKLKGFLSCVEGIDEFTTVDISAMKSDPLPEYDYHFPIMSAPHLLGVEKITGEPYTVSTVTTTDFRALIQEQCSDTFNVGIVWTGNEANPDNRERAIPLAEFKRLRDVPGVRLFSVQTGEAELTPDFEIPDLREFITDFASTSRVLNGLDLLICCDTAIAHVAGSMGFPVWNLIRRGPDWRWPDRQQTTHWYDSMKLYHQTEAGNWSEVFERVEKDLTELVQNRAQ